MKHKNLKRLSKFMSYLLRHNPERFNLKISKDGFVEFKDLWRAINKRFPETYSLRDIQDVIEGKVDGRRRYEVKGDKIRALYGHSIDVEIQYQAVKPPPILYHGTAKSNLKSILEKGLLPMGRKKVHLSKDVKEAKRVALRHSKDIVILKIDAIKAYNSGIKFYHPETFHYLTDKIPPEFISVEEK